MSGGVNSAVAAARAADAGHDVTGVHLALSQNPRSYRTGARGCCTLEDARDARRAADVIGIPFYVWDMAGRFARTWWTTSSPSTRRAARPTPACAATRRSSSPRSWTGRWRSASTRSAPATTPGSTPRRRAAARRRSGQGPVLRARGPDPASSRARCSRWAARRRRRCAKRRGRGLAVADKPDSHDVCFIADGDTQGSWPASSGPPPGRSWTPTAAWSASTTAPTVHHRPAQGPAHGRPAGDGKPRYVLDIAPVTNTVTVGPAEALDAPGSPRSARSGPAARRPPRRSTAPSSCARTARSPCVRRAGGDDCGSACASPARGVAPGQAAVLYDGDPGDRLGHHRRHRAGLSRAGLSRHRYRCLFSSGGPGRFRE